jgi:hypothetical protein
VKKLPVYVATEYANVPRAREKLEEVRRTTQSALLHRLIQMIDSMPLKDWVVYALTIMSPGSASGRVSEYNFFAGIVQ